MNRSYVLPLCILSAFACSGAKETTPPMNQAPVVDAAAETTASVPETVPQAPVEAKSEPNSAVPASPIFVDTNDIVRTIHHPVEESAVGKGIIATDEVIQEVVILDVTPKMAALKLVSHREEEPDGLAYKDCTYAGMDGQKVQLALIGLDTPTAEEWHVYPTPPFQSEDSECVPHEKSKATLEAAKVAMNAAGLDIKRKPSARTVPKEGLVAQGRTYTFNADTGRTPDSALFREVFDVSSEEATMQGVSQLDVLVDGEVRYRIRETFGIQMAGQLSISALKAVEMEDGVAFVLKHSFTSGRGNGVGFSMTPVLK